MLQREFIERTGLTPSNDEFQFIHELYMNTSLTKDEFCEDYKKHGDSTIITSLNSLYNSIQEQNDKLIKEKEVLDSILLRAALDFNIESLYNEVVGSMGLKKIIIFKLENKYVLNDMEKDFIISHLV